MHKHINMQDKTIMLITGFPQPGTLTHNQTWPLPRASRFTALVNEEYRAALVSEGLLATSARFTFCALSQSLIVASS
jgi:hypothetical protein